MMKLSPVVKNNNWLYFTVLLVCFAISVGMRGQQFEKWKETPSNFFVQDRPIMTTLDAPYWLRWAREYNEGVLWQKSHLREYPQATKTYLDMSVPAKFKDHPAASSVSPESSFSSSETLATKYSDVPLLSFMIAILAPYFNYNYYLTGTLLVPILASLFILPLGVYFFRVGVPLPGLLGGLVGTFSGGYYMRSSIGRIDTDMLNLFFPVLAALLILLVSQAKTERSALLYSIATGFSLYLFQWWYSKAGFAFAYFAILVFMLFIQKFRLRIILLCSLLFVLCVHPAQFMAGTESIKKFLSIYYASVENDSLILTDYGVTPATFPDTFTTISEVDSLKTDKFIETLDRVFQRIINKTLFAWAGFTVFLILAFWRWKDLLPLAPMLALGLLSFQSSNRFIMYLGPFIGVGLGWLLNIGLDWMFHFLAKNTKEHKRTHKETKTIKTQNLKLKTSDTIENTDKTWLNWIRQGTLYLGMGLFFWMISSQTAISYVPGPSIHPRLYATFLEVKKMLPENSALLTWWDYGYAITDVTGLATFHDGGGQNTPVTYFTARGLISPDQDELYDITKYLATESIRGIAENNISPEALMTAVRNPTIKPWDPIYLFFTADMTGKYGAISKLGSWDIVNGGSKPRGYQNLSCNNITNEEMNCRGAKIDLKVGKINNQVPLKRVVFIRDGKVLRVQEFANAQGYTLQLLVTGKQIVEVQLIDEEVYSSNYNQMFLLGRYEGELFEETYNAFPFSRLYRVKY